MHGTRTSCARCQHTNITSSGCASLPTYRCNSESGPRLVKLVITSQGEDSFSTGGSSRKAIHYVVKVDIGGVTGLVAPLIGKKPPDTHVWILGGEAPAFVKSEGPLYVGGPTWRIELASPVWPRVSAGMERQMDPGDFSR